MAEQTETAKQTGAPGAIANEHALTYADQGRNEKVGNVVSTKMQKTIVVEVVMRKAHPKYKRVIRSSKKFYAHDESGLAHTGDVVRIREIRPLSKLKRWELKEVIQRSALGALQDVGTLPDPLAVEETA